MVLHFSVGKLNKTAEVVVIGGGVIGCSVAYYLAKKGLKVIVIEKNQGLCLSASGANMGGLYFQPPSSPIFVFVMEEHLIQISRHFYKLFVQHLYMFYE